MDKELLRIVIIAIGLLIIVGLLIWGYLNSQYNNDGDDTSHTFRDIRKSIQDKLVPKQPANNPKVTRETRHAVDNTAKRNSNWDDFEVDDDGYQPAEVAAKRDYPVDDHKMATSTLPRLIQLSIVANTEHGFNGADLDAVFNIVGLEYANSLHIYERLDMERRVDYCVGSMVNPGTFPSNDLETFYTPGVTFYMQPQELPDALSVFNDLIRTINLVVTELDGIVWDATRTPLTEITLKALRKSLQVSH